MMYGSSYLTTASYQTRWKFLKNLSGRDMPCSKTLQFMKQSYLVQMCLCTYLVILLLHLAVYILVKMSTGALHCLPMVPLNFAGIIGSQKLFTVMIGIQE